MPVLCCELDKFVQSQDRLVSASSHERIKSRRDRADVRSPKNVAKLRRVPRKRLPHTVIMMRAGYRTPLRVR